MANAAEGTNVADQALSVEETCAARVREVLPAIFKSVPFRASKQSQQLLKYIVEQALSGHVDRLKERIIGAEVFGRAIDYDTNEDPVVRSRAVEVRKRLAQYYMGEGKESLIRIEIIPGSYIPNFVEQNKESGYTPPRTEAVIQSIAASNLPTLTLAGVPPSTDLPVEASAGRRRFRYYSLALAAVLIVTALIAAYSLELRSPLRRFWSPLLDNSKPVLIYTGANPVYMPSSQLIERFKATHHLSELDANGQEFLVPVAEDEKLSAADLIGIQNEFVTIGDMSANVGVASLLTQFKHSFDLRSGEDVAFGDLRQSPAVLVGAFNNTWTLQMTGDLPFVFGRGLSIRDQANPPHEWHPVITRENKVQMDYAMVARLPQSKTGGALIAIAGITQCGTRAAAEFITSRAGIRDLMRSAPKDWESKNLELVLQTRVVNDVPTTPAIVALRTW